VVGPGLGTDEAGAAALWFALDTDLPVLVDADGLQRAFTASSWAARTPAAVGRVQAWVVGPGLGTDEAGAAALWFALDTDLPVLVDADGL
ncbi:hypothetical protein GR255_28355, partial [Mycobacterium tuberculosis]|nr:hypothetical protein [Mycobacterium tuberculosis]